MTEALSPPIVTIGEQRLRVSPEHIYLAHKLPATYDYLPWNLIGGIIAEARLDRYCLLDIGANVGDSLAHFRRHSQAPAICVEPSEQFFTLLEQNARSMGPVELIQALVAPDGLVGRVGYGENDRSGWSHPVGENEAAWQGRYVTFETLLAHSHGATILKTDTDGFDAAILHGLLDLTGFDPAKVPIIFFEGPDEEQMRGEPLDLWFSLFEKLQAAGYGLLFLTSRGIPLVYAGECREAARSLLMALMTGMRNGFAICHYFDIIAVQRTLPARIHLLESPLDPRLVPRD